MRPAQRTTQGDGLSIAQFLPYGIHARQGKRHALVIQRLRLRAQLGDHDLVRPVDEEMLPMNAESENERRLAARDIPLAAVMHRAFEEIADERPGVPGGRIAAVVE